MTEQQRLARIAAAARAVRERDAAAKPAQRHRTMAELKRGEHALTNFLARKIKGDGTHARPAQPAPRDTWAAYSTARAIWERANPGATPQQHEEAMREIAERLGA